MLKSDDLMGQSLMIVSGCFSFVLTGAVILFSQLPWAISLSILVLLPALMIVISYMVHQLTAVVHPQNDIPVLGMSRARVIRNEGAASGGSKGFANLTIPAWYLFLAQPVLNIWLLWELITHYHAVPT